MYKQGDLNKYYQSRGPLLLLSLIGRKIAKKTALIIGATTAQLTPENGVDGDEDGVDWGGDGGAVGEVTPVTVNEPGRPLISTE